MFVCFLPCTQPDMCAAGIPGILANSVCCPSSCGLCGGEWVKNDSPTTRMTHQFHSHNNIRDLCTVLAVDRPAASWEASSRFHDTRDLTPVPFPWQALGAVGGTAATVSPARKLAAEGGCRSLVASAPPASGHRVSSRMVGVFGFVPRVKPDSTTCRQRTGCFVLA